MKKILTVAILLFASVLTYACTDKAQAQQKKPEKKEAKSGLPFEKIDGVLITHEHYDHVPQGNP